MRSYDRRFRFRFRFRFRSASAPVPHRLWLRFRTGPPPRPLPAYVVTGCPPAAVTSRTQGVLASTRLLFCTSQEP